jgi:glycosyltransferase involved in cell wall biosynthesis
VIVVANGCQDATASVARDRCDKLIELPEKALGRARNTGAAKARGDLLLFLDADTALAPDALEVIAREFTPQFSCGTVRGQPDSGRWSHSFVYALKNSLHRSTVHCGSSGVILCWRDYFKAVSGFDEQLQVRENSELMGRLRRFGPYKYVAGARAITSMRRYQNAGTGKVMWRWFVLWLKSLVSDLRQQTYEVVR